MEENNGERERARVLAALAAVDAVVVFDEPTSLEVILATRPEVVVKGGDRAVDALVGASGWWAGVERPKSCRWSKAIPAHRLIDCHML